MNVENTSSERIIWTGKPQFFPYMVRVVPLFLFGLIWCWFIYRIAKNDNIWALSPFILAGLWLVIAMPIRRCLMYKNIFYILTESELTIRSGALFVRNIVLSIDDIIYIESSMSYFDKMLGKNIGSLYLYTNFLTEKRPGEFGGNFKLLSSPENRYGGHGYFVIISIPDVDNVNQIFKGLVKSKNTDI